MEQENSKRKGTLRWVLIWVAAGIVGAMILYAALAFVAQQIIAQ